MPATLKFLRRCQSRKNMSTRTPASHCYIHADYYKNPHTRCKHLLNPVALIVKVR